MSTEARLRTIGSAPSSKLTNSVRSPRLQAASANLPARVVFDVPGRPVTRVLLPRNRPPPSILSRRSNPAEMRSVDAWWRISAGSGGASSIPEEPKPTGNSPAMKSEPRYLVICSRCSEIPCSRRRVSRTTQSTMNCMKS
jgi:hypothetical protein